MRKKLVLVMLVLALLATVGFLSYQVYERNKAINNLQVQIFRTEFVLGMCTKANKGLQEKIQNQPAKEVSNLLMLEDGSPIKHRR